MGSCQSRPSRAGTMSPVVIASSGYQRCWRRMLRTGHRSFSRVTSGDASRRRKSQLTWAYHAPRVIECGSPLVSVWAWWAR